ncbi:MAG: hypothetical protein ACTHMZ_05100 [Actinomycetes bacterium]
MGAFAADGPERPTSAYTIPTGFPGLSGLSLAWKVVNGTPDAVGFSVASSAAAAATMVNAGFTPSYSYRTTARDLTVVQVYLLPSASGSRQI